MLDLFYLESFFYLIILLVNIFILFSGSDELRPSRGSENQKNEHDALQNLLQSLENKRKASEMSHDQNELKPSHDQSELKPSPSLHTKIGNARKMFEQGGQPSKELEGENKENCN